MATKTPNFRREMLEELDALPPEFHALLLQMIRAYRQSVMLKSAEESFVQGWTETRNGDVRPIDDLWEGIDAK